METVGEDSCLALYGSPSFRSICLQCQTFTEYMIQARASGKLFDATRAFTALSLLVVMTQPLNQLMQSTPGFLGAIGCFQRISEFLSAEEQKDFRDFEGYDVDRSERQTLSQALVDDPSATELTAIPTKLLSNQPTKRHPIVRISDGCFG